MGVKGCYDRAKELNYTVFAIENEKSCYTSLTAENTYQKYGPSVKGCSHVTGINEIYKIENEGRFLSK